MHKEKGQDALAAYHARRLEEFRSETTHREMAITAAMHYCAEVGITPPQWLTSAAASLLRDLLKSQRTTKVGRNAGVLRRFRQDQIDLERWFAVNAVRDIRKRADREKKAVEQESSQLPPKHLEYKRAQIARQRKWSRHGTLRCASMYLLGSEAFAGPEAVRASYRKIEKINISGEDRWCIFELDFLEKLGVAPTDGTRGKKLLHLFDLTP
jgi:hypothetical protein